MSTETREQFRVMVRAPLGRRFQEYAKVGSLETAKARVALYRRHDTPGWEYRIERRTVTTTYTAWKEQT